MKSFAEKKKDLNVEERNLLSVAYKNVVGSRRSSWRVLSSIGERNSSDTLTDYKAKIVTELQDVCKEVLVSCGYGTKLDYWQPITGQTWTSQAIQLQVI